MARIKLGLQSCLYLGNLDAKRDWGHAKDYAEAQWLMLQQAQPDDYVVGTGRQYSVRQFVEASAKVLELDLEWRGTGMSELAQTRDGRVIVRVDPRYFRPAEVDALLSDARKAREQLGWTPKTSFEELVRQMCEHDLVEAEKDALIRKHGYKVPSRNER